MDLQSKTMSKPMPKVLIKRFFREGVPRNAVDLYSRHPGADRRKCALLRRHDCIIESTLARIRMPHADRSRNVRMVSHTDSAKVHRHEFPAGNLFLACHTMRKAAADSGSDDCLKRRSFRALTLHEMLHFGSDLQLRHARFNVRKNMGKGCIGDCACAPDKGNLIRVLYLTKAVKRQRCIEGYLSKEFLQLLISVINKRTALKSERKHAAVRCDLGSLPIESIPLLDDFIVRCLHRSLLGVTAVCHKHKAVMCYDKHRRITTKSAEIMEVLLLCDKDGIHNLL